MNLRARETKRLNYLGYTERKQDELNLLCKLVGCPELSTENPIKSNILIIDYLTDAEFL